MSRKKPVVTPDPVRYLSTNLDPRASTCSTCDGLGRVRRGPGDYADCAAPGCKGGKVTPPADAPRLWRVIGFGTMPECRDSAELADVLTVWGSVPAVRDLPWKDIPVWDGDAGSFTTLDAIVPAPQAPGTRVRLYSIGYGRTFPGVITRQTSGGAFATTEGYPDGDGERYYPSRYIVTDGGDNAR